MLDLVAVTPPGLVIDDPGVLGNRAHQRIELHAHPAPVGVPRHRLPVLVERPFAFERDPALRMQALELFESLATGSELGNQLDSALNEKLSAFMYPGAAIVGVLRFSNG